MKYRQIERKQGVESKEVEVITIECSFIQFGIKRRILDEVTGEGDKVAGSKVWEKNVICGYIYQRKEGNDD